MRNATSCSWNTRPRAPITSVCPDTPSRVNALGDRPVSVTPRRTETLTQLLDRYAPEATQIDFLNIDCEGLDLAVLHISDWSRWLPRVIAVEANTPDDRGALIGSPGGPQWLPLGIGALGEHSSSSTLPQGRHSPSGCLHEMTNDRPDSVKPIISRFLFGEIGLLYWGDGCMCGQSV